MQIDDLLPIKYESFHPKPLSVMITATPYKINSVNPTFLHCHNYIELGICLSGSGLCYLNGITQEYKKSDVQVILPHQPHYNVASELGTPAEWIFICFTPLKLDSDGIKPRMPFISELMQSKITANGVFPADEYPHLAALINLLYELSSQEDNSGNIYNKENSVMCCVQILIELAKISESKKFTPHILNKGPFDLILPSINIVIKNTTNSIPVTVTDMAKACNMSESHFRKTFTSVIGYSPKAYIDKTIANLAAKRLENTNESVSEIAASLGFEEISTFYRLFTKHFRMSPSEYRKIFLNKNHRYTDQNN